MTPFWLISWAFALAAGWLLPNHQLPWSTFHTDAWVALLALIGAFAPIYRFTSRFNWHVLTCMVAALVFLPWLQFGAGLMPFAGQAWISSAYLLGFLLALLIGAQWEVADPLQLSHALFLAIGVAAIVSVGLQLGTWLDVIDDSVENIWSMGLTSNRPYANFGQPNNLATFLIWGLLACLWAYLTGALGSISGVFAATFLLFGLAMTQSRMGYLALTVILAAVWFWRRLWPSKRLPLVATGLYIFFLTCPFLLRSLNTVLLFGQDSSFVRLAQEGELRLGVWRLFLQAALERPWVGFGWTSLTSAQLSVADQFANLGIAFGSSHNLFLDLVLWAGLPLGLLISFVLLQWFWQRLRSIRQSQDAVLMLMLAVVSIHAMVELPLQYACFLLPTGLIMGILNVRLGAQVVITSPRSILMGLWLASALILGLLIRDYFRVEASYNAVRFELARIKVSNSSVKGPPEVLLLTQFHELIRFARVNPRPNMSASELQWMREVAVTFPSAGNLYSVATALALNKNPQEARIWLVKTCRVVDQRQCASIKTMWSSDAKKQPELALVAWPG